MRLEGKNVTPELAETIRAVIDSVLVNANFCVPAKIVSYDSKTQYATVQVQLQKKYEDGNLVTIPPIPNVPVKHARAAGGKARIHLPLAKGDDVLLVFSQRSIDNWKIQGGITDPADRRKFHLTDAFALVGGSAMPDAFTVTDPTAIEMVNDQTRMAIRPDGKFNVWNGSTDLMSTLKGMADTLSTASTIMGGPFVPTVVTALEQYSADLGSLGA